MQKYIEITGVKEEAILNELTEDTIADVVGTGILEHYNDSDLIDAVNYKSIVLRHVTESDAIDHFGTQELLEHMTIAKIIEYYGEGDLVEGLSLKHIIGYWGTKILNQFSEEEVCEYFNLKHNDSIRVELNDSHNIMKVDI